MAHPKNIGQDRRNNGCFCGLNELVQNPQRADNLLAQGGIVALVADILAADAQKTDGDVCHGYAMRTNSALEPVSVTVFDAFDVFCAICTASVPAVETVIVPTSSVMITTAA